MIILYEKDEKSFTSLGIGVLTDAINPTVAEEINGSYELEMDYPVDGQLYKEIKNRRIILCKPNEYSQPQPFRIYEISKPINGIVTINAAHISYDTSGYPVKSFIVNRTDGGDIVGEVFDKIQNECITSSENMPFTFDHDTGIYLPDDIEQFIVDKPTNMRSILLGRNNSLPTIFKTGDITKPETPEYEYDRFNISLKNRRGSDKGFEIRYGKNMTDFEQSLNSENEYTAVFPFYSSSSTVTEQKTIKDYAKAYLAKKDPDGNVPETFGDYWLTDAEDIAGTVPTDDRFNIQIYPINAYIREGATEYGSEFLSLKMGGSSLSPVKYQTYKIVYDPDETNNRKDYIYQWNGTAYVTNANNPKKQGIYNYCKVYDSYIADTNKYGLPGWLSFGSQELSTLGTIVNEFLGGENLVTYPSGKNYCVIRNETSDHYTEVYKVVYPTPYTEAYIVEGSEEKGPGWLTDTKGSTTPLTPVDGAFYRLKTGGNDFNQYFIFKSSINKYEYFGDYKYEYTNLNMPLDAYIAETDKQGNITKLSRSTGGEGIIQPKAGLYYKIKDLTSPLLYSIYKWENSSYVEVSDKSGVFYPWQLQSNPPDPTIDTYINEARLETTYVDLATYNDAYVNYADVEPYGDRWLCPQPNETRPFQPPIKGEVYKVKNDYQDAINGWINPDASPFSLEWLLDSEEGQVITPIKGKNYRIKTEGPYENKIYTLGEGIAWDTPTIELNGDVVSTDIVSGVTKYKVYSDGVYIGYVDENNIWHGESSGETPTVSGALGYVEVTERFVGKYYKWQEDSTYVDAVKAYIIPGATAFSSGWLSLEDGSATPLTPTKYGKYKIQNGSEEYIGKVYAWNGTVYSNLGTTTRYVEILDFDETKRLIYTIATEESDERVLTLDLTSEFSEKPIIEDLRKKAEEYIAKNDLINARNSINVSFVKTRGTNEYYDLFADLEKVELGDSVNIVNERLDVSKKMRVIRTVYNVLKESYDEIELGNERETIVTNAVTTEDGVSVLMNDSGYTNRSSVNEIIAKTINAEFITALNAKFTEAQIEQLKSDRIVSALIEATSAKFSEIISDTLTAGKVIVDGTIYAKDGYIGGFAIRNNDIATKEQGLGEEGSVYVSPGSEEPASIGGSKIQNGWAFAAGKTFGVDKDGNVYANSYNFSGGTVGNIDSSEVGMTVSQQSTGREKNNGYTLDPSGKVMFNDVKIGGFAHPIDLESGTDDQIWSYDIYKLPGFAPGDNMEGDGVIALTTKYLARTGKYSEVLRAIPLSKMMNSLILERTSQIYNEPYSYNKVFSFSIAADGNSTARWAYDPSSNTSSSTTNILQDKFSSIEHVFLSSENPNSIIYPIKWIRTGTGKEITITTNGNMHVEPSSTKIHVFVMGIAKEELPDLHIVESKITIPQEANPTGTFSSIEFEGYGVGTEKFSSDIKYPEYITKNYTDYSLDPSRTFDSSCIESIRFAIHDYTDAYIIQGSNPFSAGWLSALPNSSTPLTPVEGAKYKIQNENNVHFGEIYTWNGAEYILAGKQKFKEYYDYTRDEIDSLTQDFEFSQNRFFFATRIKRFPKAVIRNYESTIEYGRNWLGKQDGQVYIPVYGDVFVIETPGEHYHKLFKWTYADKYEEMPGMKVDDNGEIYFNLRSDIGTNKYFDIEIKLKSLPVKYSII